MKWPIKTGRVMVIFASVVAAMMAAGERAEALCNMSTEGLDECRPSVTAPSPTEPSKACCDALAGADLACLCSYRNSIVLPSLGIDPDLAMQLPAKCGLTPPADCTSD